MIQKYFTEKQIYVATFFGGPIPAGILIFKNLKRINDDRRASLTLMFTFIFTILLFFLLVKTTGTFVEEIPDFVFTAFYTIIVYLLYHNFLEKEIGEKVALPENKESNWRVAGWTALGLFINMIIIIGISNFEPAFPGEKMTFGKLEHEVFYDKSDFSDSQIQDLGKMLTELEYFYDDDAGKRSVRIEMREGEIFLMMPFLKDYWEDQVLINELNNFNIQLQRKMKSRTTIELIHYEINGDIKTKEITSFENPGS